MKLTKELIQLFYTKHNLLKPFICLCQIPEETLREYANLNSKHDWSNISKYQTLSEDFMREFQDKLDMDRLVRYQKIPEAFISEIKDRLCERYIVEYQKLSENYIRELVKYKSY